MGTDRISRTDSKFDIFIRNTTVALLAGSPTGAVRLGLTTDQADQWVDYRDQWVIIYPVFTNLSTRTKTVTQDKNQLKADFIEFAQPLLRRIDVNENITTADRDIFNLPLRDTTLTRRGAITDVPFGSLTGKGGGIVEVRARRASDATRSSKHPLADAVELRYIVIGGGATPPDEGGGDIPLPEDCPNIASSKAALWRISLGAAARGKTIVGYLRWVNLTNPANNSGWSLPLFGIVS